MEHEDDRSAPVEGVHLHAEAAYGSKISQAGRDLHIHYGDGAAKRRRTIPGEVGEECPYPGLNAFGPDQARWFFGREALIAELVECLDHRLVSGEIQMVVAPSGAGKSSLLRAGLLPKLAKGALPGSRHWPQIVLTPTASPLEALCTKVASLTGSDTTEPPEEPVADPQQCVQRLRRFLSPGDRVVLVVDQFEELFTLCTDLAQRRQFVDLLTSLAGAPSDAAPQAAPVEPIALVVVGLRADAFQACLDYPPLSRALQDRQLLVGAMDTEQLCQAITIPAQDVGLELQDGLVEVLLRDLGAITADGEGTTDIYEAGRLPLLAHALRASWQERHGATLTVEGYRDTGGIQRAIATSARHILEKLDPAGQNLARLVFLRLIKIGDGADDTRRRLPKDVLMDGASDPAKVTEVVDLFIRARLLTQHESTVEITHDALLRSWPKLREWIEEDRAGRLTRQGLEEAAATWNTGRRDPALLYRGRRLADAESWTTTAARDDLSPVARSFLTASIRLRRRAASLRNGTIAVLAVLTVVATTAGVLATRAADSADRERVRAVSQRLAAQAHEVSNANPRASALLALAAWNTSPEEPTPEARGAILSLQNQPLTQVAAGHDADVIASNDEGNLFAELDKFGDVAVRDKQWHRLTSGIGRIYRIAFGAGTTFAAAGERGVEIWTDPARAPTGTVVSTAVADRTTFVSDLAFGGKDDQTLYASQTNGTVHRWSTVNGRTAGPPISTGGHTTTMAAQRCAGDEFQTKQCLIATADQSGTLRLFDAETGRVDGGPIATDLRKHALSVYDLAFSPDGDALAIASDDQRVHLWSITKKDEIGDINSHNLPVQQLTFAPHSGCSAANPCVLATISYDGIRVWNIHRNDWGAVAVPIVWLESQGHVPTSAAFANEGDDLVASYNDGSQAMWNVDRITVDGAANEVAFDPAGTPNAGMAVVNGRGQIYLMSQERGGSIDVRHGYRARNYVSVAYGPTGGRWAAAGDGNDVYVSDNSHEHSVIAMGGSPLFRASDVEVRRVVFGSNNNTLYTADADGRVRKWAVNHSNGSTTARLLKDLAPGGAKNAVINMTTSTDRSILAATFSDGTVQLWRTDTDEPVRAPIKASETGIYGVAFSTDRSTFFTGDTNGVIRRWDTATGKQVGTDATGHSGPVASLAVSPDGRTLASGSHDHTVRLWTISPGEPPRHYADLVGHADKVNTVTFNPRTKVLFSGSDDRSILKWDLGLRGALRKACQTSRDDIANQDAWKQLVPSLNYAEHKKMCDKHSSR